MQSFFFFFFFFNSLDMQSFFFFFFFFFFNSLDMQSFFFFFFFFFFYSRMQTGGGAAAEQEGRASRGSGSCLDPRQGRGRWQRRRCHDHPQQDGPGCCRQGRFRCRRRQGSLEDGG